MRRLLGAFIAFALAAPGAPAAAAEITAVASSGEAKNPFDLDLSVRYERMQQAGTVTREGAQDELRLVRTRHQVVPRIAIGLYHDLEIHFEMPYVLADDHARRFGDVYGKPSGGVPPFSSIENNGIDANGQPCTFDADPSQAGNQCPLFPVGEGVTVYHGGVVGDLKAGLAWGIFNDVKDDTKPFWVVGVDLTFPTAQVYDPAKDRLSPDWASPYTKANPGPIGEKVWKFDVYTALSKRMGVIDPYVKVHATKMFKTNATYSNCDHADVMTGAAPVDPVSLATVNPVQMNSQAVANCKDWGDEAGAQLPWIAGVTLGTEVVPYEDKIEGQKVSFDFRLFADYTSPQRFYNELTDATGKIHQTGSYVTMGGLFGLYLQASEYVSLQATASLATRSAHYLTGESLGPDGSTPVYDASGVPLVPGDMNPNFDWRYDAPGRRFRISEVSIFELGFSGVLRF